MSQLNIISWFDNSTVKHLRFPFSYHLMPVFLFALSQSDAVNWETTIIAFIILHLLVYPSSNGYNSYQDKDETSIGGLKDPPRVSQNLFYATILLDIIGAICSLMISVWFSVFVTIYILISRAYSYRNLRLKKYPFMGFITVFIFQGAFTYTMVSVAITDPFIEKVLTLDNLICMMVASLFIGSVYPLTQIYQHAADKKDGVTTISYKLGHLGTFIFSAILFSAATILLYYYFNLTRQRFAFLLFLLMMLPVVLRLIFWSNKVRKDTIHANFENTMSMNLLASTCMNLYFLALILNNYYVWF